MDELVLSVEDLLIKMKAWFAEEDSAKKVEKLLAQKFLKFQIEIFKSLCESEIVPFLTRFENHVAENATGFFVGDKVRHHSQGWVFITSYE